MIFSKEVQHEDGSYAGQTEGVEFGGKRIYFSENPIGAALLALECSEGKSAKARAWDMAEGAVKGLAMYYPELAEQLRAQLGRDHYPAAASAAKWLEANAPY